MKLIGYGPDIDPTTPGVITDCNQLVPTLRGMRSAFSSVDTPLAALASACRGAIAATKLDTTRRLIAGTATKLYEAGSSTWTDRTRAVGGDYTLGTGDRWRFAQFGNVTIAVAKTDTPQASTTGAFSAISAAPKARIVETVNQFVFLFDTNDGGSYGDRPDSWWCSAIGDYTDWTPAIATQCATARLTSSPGPVTAGRRLGDYVVAYKDSSMFLGVYGDPTFIWDFKEIADVGAPCQEAVVPITTASGGYAHLFMGNNDFYYFDGSRPVAIGSPVKETVFKEINRAQMGLIETMHDRIEGRVYFFYPTGDTLNKCVVYNYRSNQWGRDDRAIEAAVNYITGGLTYEDLGSSYSTYADLPNIAYDKAFLVGGTPIPATFNSSHKLQTMNGMPNDSYLVTGDVGDDFAFSTVTRVKPRYIVKPDTATLTHYYRNNLGDALTTGNDALMVDGKFDVLQSARWHRAKVTFQGPVEITHLVYEAERDGSE